MFFICLAPFCLTKFLKVLFANPFIVPPYVSLVASIFAFMACVVNPFIYGILRHDFRVAYHRLYMHCIFLFCRPMGTLPQANRFRTPDSSTYNLNHSQMRLKSQANYLQINEVETSIL